MIALSFRLFLLAVLYWTQWTSAIPIDNVAPHTSEDIVWETVVVTKKTTICLTTLPSSTSSTSYYTTTVVRPASSSASFSHVFPSSIPSLSVPNTATLSSNAFATNQPPLPSTPTVPSQPLVDSSPVITSSYSTRPASSTAFVTPAPPSGSTSTNNRPPSSPTVTTMGLSKSKTDINTDPSSPTNLSSSEQPKSSSETWRSTWKTTLTSFGITTTATPTPPQDNIFVPIQQDNILPQIPIGKHHPVERKGIEDDSHRTLHTNKFYANAFLGNQDQPIWTHPYSLWWGKGHTENGQFPTWGMNIGHIEFDEIVYGDGDPARNYINPRRQSLILSARELNKNTSLTTDTHLPFSVNINLNHDKTPSEPKITFPVVQGMTFVTGGYRNATPMINCPGKGFRSITGPLTVGKSTKYRLQDADGRNWVAYINPVPSINYDAKAFIATDPNTFTGPSNFKGTIQIAKNPLSSEGEALYDKAAGAFVTEAKLTGTVNETKGTYSLSYTKVGSSPLLMFVLPHHIQSLDPELKNQVTKLQLRTTTKGTATAIWADKLTFVEPNLPISMGFGPWTPLTGPTSRKFSAPTLEVINAAAGRDLDLALKEKLPEDSMYYAGKYAAKLATIVWMLKDVLNNHDTYTMAITKLKDVMAKYVQNRQRFPLFYDDTWKGLVSNAGFNDPGADFGNTYYNDHHFHYGYFVYAAAVLGYCEPDWLNGRDNKAWVNSLVKDYAESDYNSRDYPFSRNFDWWNGHSWAKGLFESADGKDEESTSEDGFASFAIKMWGKVINDTNMEKRGNLMLALQARSFNNYFYMTSTNTNQPPRFINNSVTGILFENKVDHATYFGLLPELIHGIHILPPSPASTLLRPKAFVREEWDRFFSGTRALVSGGWRGILMSNLAIIDPKASWEFFKNGVNGVWDDSWIDGGGSRSWYLVFAAGLGGAR